MREVKLFCIPYAGGSAAIYNSWKNICESIEVQPIELSGRGARHSEPLYNNLGEAVEDIYNTIVKKAGDSEFLIYGHSMGALLAYEVYNKLFERNNRLPTHLYVSGRQAPHSRRKKRSIHNLPYEEFKQSVMELGGTPPEFFDIPELSNLFIPILRSDFKICETYQYEEKRNKIQCPITVLSGLRDDINIEEIEAWKEHTKGSVNVKLFDGGHFFIHEYKREILQIIRNNL